MGLDITNSLIPMNSPFYNIIPGNVVVPLGQVVLVNFETIEHYYTRYIYFLGKF
jgi:hypothetical protein